MEYAGRSDLFEGLSIWEHEKYRRMQGTWPVIFLSFANVKEIREGNRDVKLSFEKLLQGWFGRASGDWVRGLERLRCSGEAG